MDFLLLGPFEARAEGRRIPLGRHRERCLLAVLLLEANRLVSTDRLVSLLWSGQPPAMARQSVQVHVSRLRGLLGRYPTAPRLVSERVGYRVEAAAESIDAHRFRTMVERAGTAGDPADRAALFRGALDLWRGPLLADLTSLTLPNQLQRGLDELRGQALEGWLGAELDRGRHREVLPDLAAAAAENPRHDGVVALHALALQRSGRSGRPKSAPGPLAEREVSPCTAAPLVPGDFAGRTEEVAALDELMGKTPALGVLSGLAGVGKTALALHWARARASDFPDGVVYVEVADGPLGETTRLVLESLGLPDDRIPDDATARADLYRATVVGRRLLILDNVPEAAQVREALPSDPDVVVLAISRYALPGLAVHEHAHQLRLEPLPLHDAVNICPSQELAQLCAGMPLALRLVRGSAVKEVKTAEREAGIPAAFEVAYQSLGPEEARVLRMLSALPLTSIGIDCAASVFGLSQAEAIRILETLARRELVSADGYRMHELVRLYALERAHAEEPPARLDAALRRAAGWYRASTGTKEWFDRERENLAAMVKGLSGKGWHGLAADLAASLSEFYHRRRLWREWVEVYTCACASARLENDWRTSVRLLAGLGVAHRRLGRFEQSADAYLQALDIATGVGDELAIGPILAELGGLCLAFGRLEQARQHLEAALAVPGYAGDPRHAPVLWLNLTHLHFQAGDLERAAESLHRGVALAGAGGDASTMARLHHWAGELALRQRCFESAAGSAAAELEIARSLDDRLRQAYALDLLASATAHRQVGRARSHWLEAQALCDELGHPLGEEIAKTLKAGGQARPERRLRVNLLYV